MMRNCPDPSVVTDRTFSIRAGLAASTVTPGSTAPEVSRTVPAIVASAWAKPRLGTSTNDKAPIATNRTTLVMQSAPSRERTLVTPASVTFLGVGLWRTSEEAGNTWDQVSPSGSVVCVVLDGV